jgi:hypothetical protein
MDTTQGKARRFARCQPGEDVWEAARRVWGDGVSVRVWDTPESRALELERIGTVQVRRGEEFPVHRRVTG